MSKFDYECFCGDCNRLLAVNKEKYTKEQAIDIAKEELERFDAPYYIVIENMFVRHRAGVDDDGEKHVTWWLEDKEHKRCCPVWCFHTIKSDEGQGFIGVRERR